MIMKKAAAIIILILANCFGLAAQNNFIVCGKPNIENDIFTDIADTLIYPILSGGAGGSCNFYIDLDENGQSDLKINTTAYASAGGGAQYITLSSINNQVKIALGETQVDSFPEIDMPGDPVWTYFFYTNIPKVFNYNDTVDQRYDFCDSIFYLGRSQGGYFTITSGDWVNIGEKYVGVSMQVNDVTLYGWILVEVTNYSRVIVKEFACNKNPYIGIVPGATAQAFDLYPNPAKNEVCIKLKGENASKTATFTLYDLSGKKLLQVDDIPQNGRIALPEFAKGLYIADIEVEGQRFTEKLAIE